MFELLKGIQSIMETCMELKTGERVLIIADSECEPFWIGQLAMNVANSMGAEAVLTVMAPRQIAGQEPPVSIAAAWKTVDAVLQISGEQGMTHTNARKDGTAAGVRYYNMIQVPLDEIKQGASKEDVHLIKDRTVKLAHLLGQTSVARVTNQAGTSITMRLKGREGIALHPMSRTVASIPAYGEAAIAPVEETTEGIIVVDLAVIGWGYLFKEPLNLIVQRGKVTDVSGQPQDAERFRKIAETDSNSSNIAELGIGTSHVLPAMMHGTRRDAARLGTVHIAIGRNNDIGGNTWSQIHLDSLISQPTIELDGKCIMQAGVLQI